MTNDTTQELDGRQFRQERRPRPSFGPGPGPMQQAIEARQQEAPPTGVLVVTHQGVIAYAGTDPRLAVELAQHGHCLVLAVPILADFRNAPMAPPALHTPHGCVPYPDGYA
jgi:hypothetical protein